MSEEGTETAELLFGSDSDSDSSTSSESPGTSRTSLDRLTNDLCNALLMTCKRTSCMDGKVFKPRVLLWSSGGTGALETTLRDRLHRHVDGIDAVDATTLCNQGTGTKYDALVLLSSSSVTAASQLKSVELNHWLVPNSAVFFHGRGEDDRAIEWHPLAIDVWRPKTVLPSGICVVKTVSVPANTAGGQPCGDIAVEREILDEHVVVSRLAVEIESGCLSQQSHSKAVAAIDDFGLCVIPNFFPAELVRKFGEAATADVVHIARTVVESHGIKLLPSPDAEANYEEYSQLTTQIVRGHGDKFTLRRGKHMNASAEVSDAEERLRHNASLLAVLEETCLPKVLRRDKAGLDKRKERTMLRRSSSLLESTSVGAIVALPSSLESGERKDQRLHVDTEHLYEHAHLPPHYAVMFLPAVQSAEELNYAVGQTAFLAGSHVGDVARRIAATIKSHAQPHVQNQWSIPDGARDGALLRPHCKAGDVILFDARTMHFGMANHSPTVHRPLLYVNYVRPWFSDYQPGGEIIVRHK